MKTLEKTNFEYLKIAFNRFLNENGHYPSVFEIDACPYLPSARQLQRIFKGGVRELRSLLSIGDIDYRTGTQRSIVAKEIGQRGLKHEHIIRDILYSKFGEMFVHEQKPFPDYSGRFDFLVYTKNLKFAVDVFYPASKQSFIGCLNYKINIYRNIPFPVYLVQTNSNLFSEFDIHGFIRTKKNSVLDHIKVFSQSDFEAYIKTLEVFKL